MLGLLKSLLYLQTLFSRGPPSPSPFPPGPIRLTPNNLDGNLPKPNAPRQRPPLIPRSLLFGNPEKTAVQLSPDGRTVAWLAPVDQTLNIWVQPFDDLLQNKRTARPVTFDTGRGIQSYSWLYVPNQLIYKQDVDGDENFQYFKVDLTPMFFDATQNATIATMLALPGVRARVVASSYKFPNKLVVALNDRDPANHDLYEMDISTGERELIVKNEKGYAGYTFDNDLVLRLAEELNEKGEKVLWRPSSRNGQLVTDWAHYHTVPFADKESTGPGSFDKTNEYVYWSDSVGRDLAAFIKRPFTNPTADVEPIFVPKRGEVSGTYYHPIEKHPIALYEDYDKPELTILDQDYARDFKIMQKAAGEGTVSIASQSIDTTKMIFLVRHDNWPSSYYAYDRRSGKTQFLFYIQPRLTAFMFSRRRPVEIKTRDGLTMLCYLSTPVEHDLGDGRTTKPLSMVLLVHGGPWARDRWGFVSTPQLLTNRGVVTLQCNFRSSTGFGKKFLNAGNGEWARKMHDDLIDAVDWAVKMKIAHPDRVAIYGGSYGGYSALVGLTVTPKKFACGVDIVGPSNLITLMKTIPAYWKPFWNDLVRKIGDTPETPEGRAYLKSRSPLFFAKNIRRPLLIAQGANDPRVKVNESEQITSALRGLSVPYTYVLYPNEGHGFVRPENRQSFMAMSEQFLQECLSEDYRAGEPMHPFIQSKTSAITEKYDGTWKLERMIVSSNNRTSCEVVGKYGRTQNDAAAVICR